MDILFLLETKCLENLETVDGVPLKCVLYMLLDKSPSTHGKSSAHNERQITGVFLLCLCAIHTKGPGRHLRLYDAFRQFSSQLRKFITEPDNYLCECKHLL